MSDGLKENPDIVPRPDPTLLTTAALKLSIDNLKERLLAEIANEKEARLISIASVNSLKEVKFRELHDRLTLIETRRLELKQDSKEAFQAALTAQENIFTQVNNFIIESSSKVEASFTKQIAAIADQANLGREALSEKVNALKERIDRGVGKETQQTETRGLQSWLIPMLVFGGISLLGMVLTLVTLLRPIAK